MKTNYEVGESSDRVKIDGNITVLGSLEEAIILASKMADDDNKTKSGDISTTTFIETEGIIFSVISASGRCWLVNKRRV